MRLWRTITIVGAPRKAVTRKRTNPSTVAGLNTAVPTPVDPDVAAILGLMTAETGAAAVVHMPRVMKPAVPMLHVLERT